MINRPLYGVRIVVTRPESKSLAEELERLGAEVTIVPLIEIRPAEGRALEDAIDTMGTYDWVVLTSVNGVAAVAQGGHRGAVADPRPGGIGQRRAEDAGQRDPGDGDEGRRPRHQRLGDDAVHHRAVRRAEVHRVVPVAALDHRVEQPEGVQRAQRRVLEGQADADRAVGLLPLDDERLDPGAGERDRRRRPGRAGAHHQGLHAKPPGRARRNATRQARRNATTIVPAGTPGV